MTIILIIHSANSECKRMQNYSRNTEIIWKLFKLWANTVYFWRKKLNLLIEISDIIKIIEMKIKNTNLVSMNEFYLLSVRKIKGTKVLNVI